MLTPCMHCGRRVRGPGSSLYGYVPSDHGDLRYRTKLCVGCAEDAGELIQEHLVEVSMDPTVPYPEISDCTKCGQPIEQRWRPIMITWYFPKREQTQYLGVLHPSCEVPEWLGQALQGGLQAA